MSDADAKEGLIKVKFDSNENKLVTKKLKALHAFQQAQAELTLANIQLLEAGIRPELGVMCW